MEYAAQGGNHGRINGDANLSRDLPLALQNRGNRRGNKGSGYCHHGSLFDPIPKGKDSVNLHSCVDFPRPHTRGCVCPSAGRICRTHRVGPDFGPGGWSWTPLPAAQHTSCALRVENRDGWEGVAEFFPKRTTPLTV